MRIITTSALALVALASWSAAVQAGPCPPGMVQVCLPQPAGTPPGSRPVPCKCDYPTGSGSWGSGGGGTAEVHKKNVPSVKANKAPGPND